LEAIIAESAAGQMTFLTTEFGKPFSAAGFGNWFREQCDMANLRHCSAHGLRKAAERQLAEDSHPWVEETLTTWKLRGPHGG
jgi:hypothetical protein